MMNSWCLRLVAVAGLFVIASATDDANANCTAEFYPFDGPQITPCKSEIILQNGQNYTLKCRANFPVEFILQESAEESYGNFTINQKNLFHENDEFKYEVYLELNNIDRNTIGFYACIRKESMISNETLNLLVDEPTNNGNISYIYIYVNGTDSLYAPMREVVMAKEGYYVAECKPTTPDVEVNIYQAEMTECAPYKRYSPKLGFIFDSDSLDAYVDGIVTIFTCGFKKQDENEDPVIFFYKPKCSLGTYGQQDQLKPDVYSEFNEFLPGESFSLNCSINYRQNIPLHLTWKLPNASLIIEEYSNNDKVVAGGIIYRNITIKHATKEYAGQYICSATNHCGNREARLNKIFVEKPYLNYSIYDKKFLKETKQAVSSFSIPINSYPPARFTYYKNNVEIHNNETFAMSKNRYTGDVTLKIHRRNVADSDNYTLSVTNDYETKNFTYDIRFKVAPTVTFNTDDKTCVLNTMITLNCDVVGYPLPVVSWIFGNTTARPSSDVKVLKIYEEKASLTVPCRTSGEITCKATNEITSSSKSRKLLVYELPNGFGIYDQPMDNVLRFSEKHVAVVKCVASLFHYSNVIWKRDGEPIDTVGYSRNAYSLVAKLKIDNISQNHSGNYECIGERFDGKSTSDKVDIKVSPLEEPQISYWNDIDGNVQTYQPINLFCQASGVPRPEIRWLKDKEDYNPENDSNIEFITSLVDYKTVNSSIFITQMREENCGEYECVATNSEGEFKKSVTLTLKEAAYIKYVIAIAIILTVLIILVIYLTCKVKKEKRFRKELAAAGLLYFKEGVTKSLNPDLGIDEQAELLPYNEKFEFPADKLVLGKQLGAGAFGVVYKADARGIINAEETTPVAVKMVKKTADNMYIKALASELKIMVHLGKHVNIVNLLGACTKNVGKRELIVIVEYCKFGNVHNYLQRHREVFIDLFSDNKEKSFGKVNRGYDSSGSTGLQSDYGTANTQDTDHTFLTNNTNRTSRKTSEGYVQPEWRSNYESDYSYDGRSPRPLTSRDLLAWAFQIARGMEYLASRRVLHGDLAARNILLADDNIVKICDFGLARSIYKNDEYQKKENSLLPVKWLAIECMTDRIFSTQSDVWSFGIVLWELFTLAKTPYPNMSPAHLLQFLREGRRLEKPTYADDRIYNLMMRCWEDKPTTRPNFTQLQETLGTFLEDNVRNHYVDLNAVYMEGNARPEGQADYLQMVSAPDYNNMVTPSPHHYVNEMGDPRRFFPPSPTHEPGYLLMSPNKMSPNNIFSPKPTGPQFDFDPRNLRPSEASSGGSELTPMLTLNNLPRSGSDSDHEGNMSPTPTCPRIEEEPDEVFDNKYTNKTLQQNAKNAQITNATNPMYYIATEKKPIENSYTNIVPNGLVK